MASDNGNALQPASKLQIMNAMRSAIEKSGLDAPSSDRVLARLSERLDAMMARGQPLPSLGRFDMTAASKLPEYTARPVQQGVSQQIGQPRPGRGR